MKQCTKCGEEKPLDAFYKNPTAKSGLNAVCKECYKERVKEYKRRNPEKVRGWAREGSKRYRQRHPERTKKATQRWRDKNREHWLALKREYNAANKERRAQDWAVYYERNRDRLRAKAQAEYDPEKKRASRKPGQSRKDGERRRARELNAFVADVEFAEILIRDAGICGICDEAVMEDTIELDHIIPLAAGGTHEPDNVQVAHRSCNRRKHVRTDYEPSASA